MFIKVKGSAPKKKIKKNRTHTVKKKKKTWNAMTWLR